jgi:WD40 repeat protein
MSRRPLCLTLIICTALPGRADEKRHSLDRHGDPLPPGAVARLGTVRLRHPGVSRVAYSSDGKTITSAGHDSTLRCWDARTGKEIWRFGKPHDYSTRFAVISSNGKLLATRNGKDSAVRVWETTTGKQLLEVRHDRFNPGLAFSPDGRVLFVGSLDGKVHRWEVATSNQLLPLSVGQRPVEAIAASPDGKLLAAAGGGEPIRLWDLAADRLRVELIGRSAPDMSLAFSPDGKMLVTLTGYDSPRLWDAATGKVIRLLGPFGTCAAFSPAGGTVAIGCGAHVRRWDLKTGKELPRLKVHREGVTSLSFSPDGAFLAAASGYNTIRIWDQAGGKELVANRGSEAPVKCLAFAPDGKTLATGGMDSQLRVWDRAGKALHTLPLKDTWVDAIAFAPDGKTLATGSFDKEIRLWDVAGGKLLRQWPTNGQNFQGLAFAPDGKTLASCTAQDGLRLWQVSTGTDTWHVKDSSPFHSVAYSPDGKLLAAGIGGRVRLWEADTGEELLRLPLEGRTADVPFVAFTADRATLCAGTPGPEAAVVWWDVKSGRETQRLRLPEREGVICCSLSPDGRTLAVAGAQIPASASGHALPTLTLWEVKTGQVRRRLPAAQGRLNALAFASDGALASAGADTTVLVWEGVRPVAGLPGRDRLSAEEVQERWAALGGDAEPAYDAVCDLVRSPEAAVAWLAKALPPVRRADPQRTGALLRDLASTKFAERHRATAELEDLAEAAEPALREALKTPLAEESRRRVERLLEKLDPLKSAKRLRALRAVEVLEGIGSPEARRLLEELAAGIPNAQLTREARAALERLAK